MAGVGAIGVAHRKTHFNHETTFPASPSIFWSAVTVGHSQSLIYIVSDPLDPWPFSGKPVNVLSQL